MRMGPHAVINPGNRRATRTIPYCSPMHLMPDTIQQEEVAVPRSRVIAVLLLLGLSCGLVSQAAAQVPKGNVFFGYSYASADLNSNDRSNLNGWEGSLEGKFLPFIGIVADLNGLYGTNNFPSSTQIFHVDASEYNFLFGPRVSFSVARVRRFAHALFG